MNQPPPTWSMRPASIADAEFLTEVVIAATKDQGRWPSMSSADEHEWREGYGDWSRECAGAPDQLFVIEVDGQPIGRLRLEHELHLRWTPPLR